MRRVEEPGNDLSSVSWGWGAYSEAVCCDSGPDEFEGCEYPGGCDEAVDGGGETRHGEHGDPDGAAALECVGATHGGRGDDAKRCDHDGIAPGQRDTALQPQLRTSWRSSIMVSRFRSLLGQLGELRFDEGLPLVACLDEHGSDVVE